MGLLNFLPEDPNKKEAMRAGLLNFGAAMLQGQGNFGKMLGQGFTSGADAYQGALAGQNQAALDQAQVKRWQLENQTSQAALDEPANIAKILGSPPSGTHPAPSAAQSLVGGVSAPSSVPSVASLPKMGQPAAPAQRESQFAKYMEFGDKLSAAGMTKKANEYYALADKLKPKLKDQRALTVDGKRVIVNIYDDGRTEVVDGVAPDAEKLNFQNTGGSTVALDPYTGKPVNTIANSQSPDNRASNARMAADSAAGRAQSAHQFGISSGQREREMAIKVGGKPMSALQETKYRTQIAKDHQSANTILSNMDEVAASAKAVKAAPGLKGATGLQSYIPSFPDSKASQAEVKLQNLEGKITSLGKAAAAASGAVGPMAVQEWKIVRDMVAAIDPSKGEKSLREQIALVEEASAGAAARLRDNYQKHYSADFERYPQFEEIGAKPSPPKPSTPKPTPAPAAQRPPQPGTTKGGYVFKGGNPADKANWVKQ